ncbi:hypothetical protein Sjap_016285 [Stephania japonica]|uniref:Alpha-galactosidase n=1 Tax=Stephania japonica TaxID=461633 RepID=A0AAP0NS83_9MAGN
MKLKFLSSIFFALFFCCFALERKVSEASLTVGGQHAELPPRGWNSYDSFSWTISEEEFLQNAEVVSKRLLSSGYQYVVVDYLWFRRRVKGAWADSLGFDVIDEWGRMVPDPERWPSSRGGKGFTEVAKKVHDMGLKFGIHVMRGISTQAVNANTPILNPVKGVAYEESGRVWRAQDIGRREKACAWMKNGFMSVDTNLGAGRAFLRSLYEQYAQWGVDFVKNDCVFGSDFDINEITEVSKVLTELNRPILYSLSPGTGVTLDMAKAVNSLVNLYRLTGDDWDTWGDVASHFDVSRDFASAGMIGAGGLQGKSWPDLDMLPLGWLTDPASNEGPHRSCRLSLDEQKTQMTLWSMAKSPLIYGGDLRKLDETTSSIITNPTLLEINYYSSNNMEFSLINSNNHLKADDLVITRKYGKVKKRSLLYRYILHLTSCEDRSAKGWVSQVVESELDRVCWRWSLGTNKRLLCMDKRKPLLTSDQEMVYKQQYLGKHHLLALDSREFCLDASPKQKLTSQELKGSSFSRCKWDANQMWEFNVNGTLMNSYSRLCATVRAVKGATGSCGVRSWIATGRTGEIYLAFFNLNAATTTISAKISDLDRVLPGRKLKKGSCRCTEVWSAKDYGPVADVISFNVAVHGCALFVLKCA